MYDISFKIGTHLKETKSTTLIFGRQGYYQRKWSLNSALFTLSLTQINPDNWRSHT